MDIRHVFSALYTFQILQQFTGMYYFIIKGRRQTLFRAFLQRNWKWTEEI